MHNKRLIKIAITNTMALLVFVGVLASCQKTKFPSAGHFTSLSQKLNLTNRSIASAQEISQIELEYKNFQDPKQIVIYCQLNSKKAETCYNIHLEDSVKKFLKAKAHIQSDIKHKHHKTIIQKYSYIDQSEELVKLSKSAMEIINLSLKGLIKKRSDFCAKNSKKDLERCLEQYIKRDNIALLNQYQTKNKLNGLEYLYLRNEIKRELKRSLNISYESIESNRKKAI